MTRTLLVGWDGATWDVLLPLLAAGGLPHLAALQRSGSYSKLRSTMPPLSPPAWTSFMTGCNPGKTNVFDFVGRDDGDGFRVTNGSRVGAPTLWRLLSRAGKKVVIINVPMTYPPELLNGVIVAGMDAPFKDRPAASPPIINQRILERFGHYRVAVPMRPHFPWQTNQFQRHYLQSLQTMTAERVEVARWLWREVQPDFMMVVLVATDRLQHVFGHQLADFRSGKDPKALVTTAIGQIYQSVDQALGTLWEEAGDANVLLMSDHGFQPYSEVFSLNSWLAENGYLAIDWSETRKLPGERYYRAILRRLGRGEQHGDLLKRAPFFQAIDWQHTKAFSFGAFGSLFINVSGRDRFGIVPPGRAYDALCNELSERLLSLRHPRRGTLLVRQVQRGDAIYHGPYAGRGPDLLLETAPGIFIRNSLDQPQRELLTPASIYPGRALPHTGMHHPDGIFLAAGPDILARGDQLTVHITDIAPTVLALHSVPIPANMDGRPLQSWLSPRVTPSFADGGNQQLDNEGQDYSAEEAAAVEKRLASLGYL